MKDAIIGIEKKNETFKILTIQLLKRGKYQPRQTFPEPIILALANSIKEHGVLQPILVRQLVGDKHYEIVAGECRWRSAQIAGLLEIPCIVKNYSDEQAAKIALIENTHREDLNPIDEAQAIKNLKDEFGYKQEELAAILGKSRASIANTLRLLDLELRVQTFLKEGTLTPFHGIVLAGLSLSSQYPLALQCVTNEWSSRQLSREAKKLSTKVIHKHLVTKDADLKKLEMQLGDYLGNPVSIEHKKDNKGVLHIYYTGLDNLEGVLDKFGFKAKNL